LSGLMKRFLTVLGLPSLVVASALIGLAQSSNAQVSQSRFSRQSPQHLLAQSDTSITPAGSGAGSGAVAPDTSITPNSGGAATAAKLPTNYGMVRSSSNGVLEVRTLDGTTKQLTVPSNLTTAASGLQRGALVGYDTDASGALTRLEPAAVEREFSGKISAINGDQVTLTSATGETFVTPVETATIARMGLVPGKELKVTTHVGTWATKICCVETPAPVTTIPVVPEPTPIQGGGEPVPPAPIRGLW
jgi:hypothetical protein